MKASYHWFFRVIAILCILSTAVTIIILPHTGPLSVPDGEMQRWKRMDVPGVVLIMGSLICFMLSLTQGPIDGWRSASFIAPFVLSWPLGIGFFVWGKTVLYLNGIKERGLKHKTEVNIPPRTAILPSTVWNITNSVIASLVVLVPMGFWGTSQLLFATYWQTTFNWAPRT